MTVVLEEGKPYLWKTSAYGTVAVHFTGFSPNGQVANITIDGGEASKQAQQFPEMSDGIYFAMPGQLAKRPATVRKPRGRAGEIRRQAEIGKTPVENVIRNVPGIGKVAFVSAERHNPLNPGGTSVTEITTKKTRRLSLNAAVKEARVMVDRNSTHFKWANNEEETF